MDRNEDRKKSKELTTNPYNNTDATRLNIVEHEKDLGELVDIGWKFEDHITRVVKRANSFIGRIRRDYVFLGRVMFDGKSMVLQYGTLT